LRSGMARKWQTKRPLQPPATHPHSQGLILGESTTGRMPTSRAEQGETCPSDKPANRFRRIAFPHHSPFDLSPVEPRHWKSCILTLMQISRRARFANSSGASTQFYLNFFLFCIESARLFSNARFISTSVYRSGKPLAREKRPIEGPGFQKRAAARRRMTRAMETNCGEKYLAAVAAHSIWNRYAAEVHCEC